MPKLGIWAVVAVAVSTMLYLIYMALTFEAPQGTTTVIIAPPVQAEPQVTLPSANAERSALPQSIFRPQPPPPVVAAAEPEIVDLPIEIEIPKVQPQLAVTGSAIRIPSLNASDSFVFENIRALQNGIELVSYLVNDQIVRKFVVFVENISRGEFPQNGLPYRSMQTEMAVRNIDENLFVMDESAYLRFDQIVSTFIDVDTDAAITLYKLLSPLFQQAYAEIGFRNVSFDDTLRLAIDNVLQANELDGPFQLVKPSVMYLYADTGIENLQAVHKQLIRIGPANTEKLRAKLLEFSSQL
ncbi:MAG: hypothetical protein ACJAY7_000141 [Pseudohongiellaceae bacterium]|jgi:hypothetical protein